MYAFSGAVGAFACRSSAVSASFFSALRADAMSCSIQTAWLKVIASPQYAMANDGSAACAFLNHCAASPYSKLCSCASPRRNGCCAAGEPEFAKATLPTFGVCARDARRAHERNGDEQRLHATHGCSF